MKTRLARAVDDEPGAGGRFTRWRRRTVSRTGTAAAARFLAIRESASSIARMIKRAVLVGEAHSVGQDVEAVSLVEFLEQRVPKDGAAT